MRLLVAAALISRSAGVRTSAGARALRSVRMSTSAWDRTSLDRATQTITITAAADEPSASIVILHGLGDTAQGWADVAAMWAGALPSARFVLPTAPLLPVTLNGGMRMPAWYDIARLDGDADRQTCDGIGESKATIDALVSREAALVGGAGRVVLAGFSQGGALALYAGLQRESEPLAAVISMSAYLPARGAWSVAPASRGVPVGFFHGDADQVVRPSWADMSVAELRGAQQVAAVSLKTYVGMAHSATQEEISDVAAFMARALGLGPPDAAAGSRL